MATTTGKAKSSPTRKASAPDKATKPARKASDVTVFTAPQLAAHIGVDGKTFRKWLRDGDGGGYDDGKYTRYQFPNNAATKKLVSRAKAALVPSK